MPLITVPLLGLGPDLDPATPGVMSSCAGFEPVEYGWQFCSKSSSVTITKSIPASSYLIDGAVTYMTNGTQVITVAYYDNSASKVKLLVAQPGVNSTYTDASRAASYTNTTNVSICQYGDYTIATNLTDVLQIRDATSSATAFADSAATGIPKAKIAVTWGPPSSPRVMLLDYNDGTAYRDGWWTSHQGGPAAAWTPDIATGAANGRHLGAGIITCGIAMGDNIVVFSQSSMWLGRFTGPPTVVEWARISSEIGCVGMYAAQVVAGVLYFVDRSGLYMFDGSGTPRLMPISAQSFVRAFNLTGTYGPGVQLVANKKRSILTVVAGRLASASSYGDVLKICMLNNKVGADVAGAGSRLWLNEQVEITMPSNVVTTNDNLMPNATTFTYSDFIGFGLNYVGSNKGDTKLLRVIPRFVTHPVSGSFKLQNVYGPTFSEVTNVNADVTVSATPWRADIVQTARWHRPVLYFAGTQTPVIVDVMLEVEQAGER